LLSEVEGVKWFTYISKGYIYRDAYITAIANGSARDEGNNKMEADEPSRWLWGSQYEYKVRPEPPIPRYVANAGRRGEKPHYKGEDASYSIQHPIKPIKLPRCLGLKLLTGTEIAGAESSSATGPRQSKCSLYLDRVVRKIMLLCVLSEFAGSSSGVSGKGNLW
jgi:hypothetical protein